MSVKPELAFDVCWEVYRGAREVLEIKRGISALNWKDTGKFLWRRDFRPGLNEWVADFALAGKAALEPWHVSTEKIFYVRRLAENWHTAIKALSWSHRADGVKIGGTAQSGGKRWTPKRSAPGAGW